ncbi:tyrosine-type recombinase/integrase [Pseudoteredinibacter isoporae]|nr:tyrosine-type recombinase/integrase [Pseudoteredinibacter isoporae]NHO86603.1 tyrosine-type recombinase/integrase [Pseudoteredinibacter isoporae]NIB24945.1 tyrosine-type recombinase/integrase [Pseudoteredinibacter isoporae]
MGGTRSEKLSRGVRIRIYSSGKESIEIQFQYKGVTCKEVLSGLNARRKNDQRYAINLKAEVENLIERGTFLYSDYFPNSKRAAIFGEAKSDDTIKSLLTDWLIDIERTHPQSTYRCYRKSCQAHLIPHFGHIKARELSAQQIRDWIRNRSGTLKSIRNDLTPLRAVLDQALNDDIIERNPLDKIKVSKLVSRSQSKSNYKVDPFTQQEIDRVLRAAKENDPRVANFLQFAFFTGLRTSELFGLQWKDIDFKNGVAHIQRAVVERELKETKTQAGNRFVILLPSALEAINDQKRYQSEGNGFVFVRPQYKGRFIDYEHLERLWKNVLERSAVRYRNPYQTRHTYASQLLSGGENPLFVAEQMGHKTTEMIMRHYGRWVEQSPDEKRHVFVSKFGQ